MHTNCHKEQQVEKQLKTLVGILKTNRNEPAVTDISAALQLIGYELPKISSVVIKPNMCYYFNASTGQTTDPRLVGALIDFLREATGRKLDITVAEADASAMQTKIAFPLLGYRKLAEQKQIKLLNLCDDKVEEKEVLVGAEKHSLKVPQTLLNSDLFINVPKLKVMRQVSITCAMKNIFGALAYPRKAIYHQKLAETIVAVNKILKPHLTVVDGLTALGRHPVRLNLLMAGTNPFAVDWVAAQVMGYQPAKVKFLALAAKEHLGDPKNIAILGENPQTYSKDFPTENKLVAGVKMAAQTKLIKFYSKISGDIIPPVLDDS
jgi:uncharacterized protein (DUF362 family)